MGPLLIERVRELEREIAEIAAADLSEKLVHERRLARLQALLERLQEIKEELAALRPAA